MTTSRSTAAALLPGPRERALMADAKFRKAVRPGPVGRAIDAFATAVSPAWGRKRQAARLALALGDGYAVTKDSRRRRYRSYAGGGADKHQDAATLFQLREMCRDADRNSPLLSGILNRWIDNVVGPTWTLQPTTADAGWNAAAREWFEARAAACDRRGRMSLRRLVRTWLRAIATDGDVLIAHTAAGLATYEADQLVSPWGGADSPAGRTIVNGVHVDPRTGADLGYYVARRSWRGFVMGDFAAETTYIPARHAMLPANLTRCSQTRGAPLLASALGTFDHLDGYIQNEQTAAEVASTLVYFIQRADPAFFLDEDGELPDWIKEETSPDGTEQQLVKSEPGQIITGAAGDALEMLNPTRPGATFEPYVVTCLRMIGAAIGMPLELVLLDFSRTTYSSARASLLQANRTFRNWQQFVIECILQPIYRRWIGQAMAAGDLPVRDDAWSVKWMLPRWAWLDPWKEIQAAERGVAMGVDTLTDTIEREGQTLDEYVAARKAEIDAFAAAGIPSTTILAPSTPSGRSGQAPDDPAPDADPDDERDDDVREEAAEALDDPSRPENDQ